ncbi:hypothetical protein OAD66_01975 [Bacteroidia bacterium]|nr:hypothetical protein [Bacteroidia bacterium]MDB4107205.1 hypothetical protein [Bacteroidia bacterium]MDB9881880.1 hypothetical protein [Bacteroidia bacterium]
MKAVTIWSFFAVFLLSSCEGFFGKKTSTDFIEVPEYSPREVAYVPVQPALESFVSPVDIIAGFDELIYVVDEATEEIISLDESGRELGRFGVKGVRAVAQNRTLDLLAIGSAETVRDGKTLEFTCIYKIDMHGTGTNFGIKHAVVVDTIMHPFYYKSTYSSSDRDVLFNKIAVLQDNRFYVTRSGTDNNPQKFGGPDDAVLLFDRDGIYLTPVSVNTPNGLFRDYFKEPRGITSFVQPPQISAFGTDHFVYTSISDNTSIRVQVIDYIETDFGASYEPRILFETDTTVADGNLTTPNKFERPVSVLVTGDGTNFIFVVDQAKDSLYQFTVTGLEGVKPPAGAASTKYQIASFGGTGEGLSQFNKPSAVAYKNRIVWVCDTDNKRVLRFKLTTDFQ